MKPRRFHWPVALTSIAVAVLLLGGYVFHRIETWPRRTILDTAEGLEKVAERVASAVSQATGVTPQVVINNRIYYGGGKPAMELAVLQQDTQVEREMTQSWLGSTKRIKLRGVYTVKIGFDLKEPFSVIVEGRTVKAQLPHARVLSIHQKEVEVLEFTNGYWNKMKAQEMLDQVAALPELARARFTQAQLDADSEAELAHRLRDRFASEYQVEVSTPKVPAFSSAN